MKGRATAQVLLVVSGSAQQALEKKNTRALLRAFAGATGVVVATTAPRFAYEREPERGHERLAALESLAAGLKTRDFCAVVLADEQAALQSLAFLRSRTDLPVAVLLGGNGLVSPALADACRKASRIWLSGRAGVGLPSALSRRVTRFRGALSGHDGRLRREARRLLGASPVPRRAAYPLSSIIVPVHNALPFLRRCVKSIHENTAAPYELILVDNASDGPTRSFIRSVRGARKIFNPSNRGFAHAVNQGMKAARGRYIVWANSDLMMADGWLERMIDCAQSDEGIGAVGPLTNKTVGMQAIEIPARINGNPRAWNILASALAQKHQGQWHEAHRLVGFCLLLKKDVQTMVGLLDERFETGCYEDFDYSLRLRQAGWRLALAHDAFVYHHEHASFGAEAKFLEHARRNREVFIDKWCRKAMAFWDEVDPHLKSPV